MNILLLLVKNEFRKLKYNRVSLLSTAILFFIALFAVIISILFLNSGHLDDPEIDALLRSKYPQPDTHKLHAILITEILLPIILVSFASFAAAPLSITSFTGEKDQNTLEPLFLVPATDSQILLSKLSVSGMISITGTIICYVVAIVLSNFLEPFIHIFSFKLLIVTFVTAPSMSIISASGGIIISVSVANSRIANSLIFLPGAVIPGIFVAVLIGPALLSNILFYQMTLVIVGMAIIVTVITKIIFNREKIILRY